MAATMVTEKTNRVESATMAEGAQMLDMKGLFEGFVGVETDNVASTLCCWLSDIDTREASERFLSIAKRRRVVIWSGAGHHVYNAQRDILLSIHIQDMGE